MASLVESSQDMIAALLHAAPDGIVITNHQGMITAFNPAAERIFKRTAEQVLGKSAAEIILPPELRRMYQADMEQYLLTGQGSTLDQRVELNLTRADGSLVPAELTLSSTRIDDRLVFIIFVRDITDRKASEQALLRTNARLMRLIENLQGGVLVEDETRHIVLVNQAFCDMFGLRAAPADLIGSDCSQSAEQTKLMFVNPEHFVQRIDTILAEQKLVSADTLQLRNGSVFTRDYVPIFFGNDYSGHLWHYHDVTREYQSRRRWERLLTFEEVNKEIVRLFLQLDCVDEALNQSLALTDQLLDVSRVYVFRIRENERILDNTHEWCAQGVNPEIENLQGLPFDDIFPSFFPLMAQYDLIAPRHISELPDDLRGVLEPQDIQTVLWMPIYLDNRIEGFVGYDETRQAREWLPEEITMARIIVESYARALERNRAERMLIDAHDEAVRTAQLRAQFVANMSHEIRTPLTGTMGMLEVLQETELDALQREFADEAWMSASRLLAIINDILDFSKIEAGQLVLEAAPLDLKAIATEVKMTLAPQIKDKPVAIVLEADSQLPYRVFGDATRIRQVLMNLVGNAVKFTHHGQVTLSLTAVGLGEQTVYVRFAVQDTGIGIAPDNLRRIFESFVQADGSTTRKYGGSGLGLSISKQLVELMGGTINVESTPDAGSRFSFTLSLPIAQVTSLQASQPIQFSDLKVLIIDDNRTARYVLAHQLENWGVHVTQAADTGELRLPLEQPSFDLVFQRYLGRAEDAHALDSIAQMAHHLVYITDSVRPIHHDVVCLKWPIDQSSLYNVLVQALETQHQSSREQPPIDLSAAGKRVLLAEDYPLNTDLVRHALSHMDIQLDCVENGQQVLDRLAQSPYDLVLMDIQMPVLDGVEATRRIRESGSTYRDIPILALTASVMRDEQDRYLAMGINAIIAKPFEIKHLRAVVQAWLAQRQPPMPAPDAS